MPRRSQRARRAKPRESEPLGAHGVWSGSLTFGLVSVPIELYSAQRRGGIPLRMLSPDGTPLARQYVCPKEEKPIERDEIVRGYPVADNKFVEVSDEELQALAPRRSRDIELQRFVDRREIDPAYFVRTYYLVPSGEQTRAYRLLAEIMEEQDRAGIASFVMRDKAYAVAIFADSGVLRAATLRFGDELRTPETVGLPKPRKVDAARVRSIGKALSALAERALDDEELRDDEPERLLALARKKRGRGKDVVEVEAPPEAEDERGGEVIDLVALLKQRLGARAGTRATPTTRRRRRAPARRG